MMKTLAISLILTSLVATTVLFPSPTTQQDHHEVILKDGHRVLVVHYDQDAPGVTKVSISPHEVEEKPAQGVFSGPRELVCDAYGKCKHKIADAIHKAKDAVSDKVHGIEEWAKEAVNESVEKRPQDQLGEASKKVTGECAKKGVIGKVKELAGDAKAIVKDGTSKEFDIIDSPKRIGEDISRNVTDRVRESAERVKEQAKEKVKETIRNVQKMRQKSLGDIVSKLKEVANDVIRYTSVIGLIHMLGFSTAYGMSVWVTFVSSYILGRYLPRQMFGMLQSRIYPVYFKAMACCVSAALLAHFASQKTVIWTDKMVMFQSMCLVSALLMVLTNLILLEPKASKAMYERMKMEKEERRGVGVVVAAKDGMANGGGGGATVVRSAASVVVERQDVLRLNEKLRRLNVYSTGLNMSTLVTLTWHMAYMSQRLQVTDK